MSARIRREWRTLHGYELVRPGDQYRLRDSDQWQAVCEAHYAKASNFPSLLFRRVNGDRPKRGRPPVTPTTASAWLQVRVSPVTLARWKTCAGHEGLSAWVTRVLDQEASNST